MHIPDKVLPFSTEVSLLSFRFLQQFLPRKWLDVIPQGRNTEPHNKYNPEHLPGIGTTASKNLGIERIKTYQYQTLSVLSALNEKTHFQLVNSNYMLMFRKTISRSLKTVVEKSLFQFQKMLSRSLDLTDL